MNYQPTFNSAEPITSQPHLDASSDSSLPPLDLPQPSKPEGRLNPLKIELKDSSHHIQEFHQYARPAPVQPPSQMESSVGLQQGQRNNN